MTNPTTIARSLSETDRVAFRNARTYPSGVWLGAPCRHLYGDNLCRLTGELTELGLAVRAAIRAEQE